MVPPDDIFPVRSRASLVNKRFITCVTVPGPIPTEYWTGNGSIWLVDLDIGPLN